MSREWKPGDVAIATVRGSKNVRVLRASDLLVEFYAAAPGGIADSFQAALRELADPKPPKPDEPTGLGAVVEDVTGDHWVRTDEGRRVWTNGRHGSLVDFTDDDPYAEVTLRQFDEIKVVRVLSEGWSA